MMRTTGHPPTRAMRRRRAVVAAISAAALALTACTSVAPPSTSSSGEPSPGSITAGGIARVATGAEMSGFDPILVQGIGAGLEKVAQVLDTLLTYDEVSGEITPRLAESMESEDAQTWILTLREGVTFTDGSPLDAEAVIFNLKRHTTEDSRSAAKALLAAVTAMEATDEYEVTITLAEPSGSFPIVFTWASTAGLIGSPKALADPEKFNANPVGAGPFEFVSWTPDDELILTKNEDYWDAGKPYLEGLEFRVLPDQQTRTDELISGGVLVSQIPGSAWTTVSESSGAEVVPVQTIGAFILPNASTGAGSDERVREALTMALDGKVTAEVLFGGTDYWNGDTTCIPWAPGSPICVEDSARTQNLKKASALIADYAADGGDPAVELTYFQGLVSEATYIQQQFSEIGLDVSLRAVSLAEYFQAEATGDYDIFIGSGGYPIFWGRLYSKGTNWGKVVYPALDEMLLEARDALTLDERNDAWRDVVQFVHDESILQWFSPYGSGIGYSEKIHFGENEPSKGTLMIYFDNAWVSE